MTRAAVCVMGADPFLNAYWLRNFATWSKAVDELHVVACGVEGPMRAWLGFVMSATRPTDPDISGTLHFEPAGTDHGVAIRKAMANVTADLVMLCEEDAYVRHPAAVHEAFARIERNETDIVGGPRGTLTPELRDRANARFGELVGETGEAGPILWPCFLFARRADLERTDRHYGAIGWKPGNTILGEDFPTEQAADTFGWASLQLRALGLRVHPMAQYRADLAAMPGWADPPWFHVGGLSTGWGIYFCRPQSELQGFYAHMRTQPDLTDWTKRVAWWQRVAEVAPGPEHLREAYRADIASLITGCGMDQGQINAWRAQFDRLVTW